ncbi:hypothetical protein ACQPXM_17685 [Kribbella sp. CA-253562]|uniref:hypothetical protein n=1 Tax=Kribbella sp. CA-253562 TaxID=3239942 RepID=UPI003D8A47CF
MPLALLLQRMTAALTATARTLTPWIDIAAREATVVERARSAFLMHWFGRRLPMNGLALRAHIANLGELNARYLAAQRSVPASQGGPNLTEPVLGFAGMLGGMLLSPAGMIAGVSLLWRFSTFSIGVLLAGLAWVVAPFLLGYGLIAAPVGTSILVGGGLLAAGAVFALAAALGDRRELRGVFDLFGSLARLMNASVLLLDQFAGPRAEVRNPLLAKVLVLGDQLAALFAQLLGAVAMLVVKVGPLLEPVATLLMGMARLTATVVATVAEVADGLRRRVAELLAGESSVGAVLDRSAGVVRDQLSRVTRGVGAQLDVLIAALTAVGTTLGAKGNEFLDTAGDFVVRLFLDHPIGRVFAALARELNLVKTVFATPVPPRTGGAGTSGITLPTLPELPAVRPFPALPTAPDTKVPKRRLGAAVPTLDWSTIERVAAELGSVSLDAPPVELGPAARAAVAGTARRPSIFAPERDELLTGLLRPVALWDLDPGRLARFRDAFGLIVGRVLPPELRGTALPGLVDPEALPVLDLPTTDDLRPVVRTLRLRMPGAHPTDVRQFEDLLVARLRARSYPAPVGGR